jgi:hypothetical protein
MTTTYAIPKIPEKLEDLLRCNICGEKYRKLDEHTYEPNCDCVKKKLRISVG